MPIFVPASISVVPATRTERNASFPTYTLNFSKSFEELQYRNGTPIVPLQLSQLVGSGSNYDGYQDATKGASGLIYNTMYGKRIVEAPSPCGANCSFTQTFNAPAYKCDDVDYNNIDPENPFCGEDDGTPGEERCEKMFNLPTGNTFQTLVQGSQLNRGSMRQVRRRSLFLPDVSAVARRKAVGWASAFPGSVSRHAN